jgi:hypothetical protein
LATYEKRGSALGHYAMMFTSDYVRNGLAFVPSIIRDQTILIPTKPVSVFYSRDTSFQSNGPDRISDVLEKPADG